MAANKIFVVYRTTNLLNQKFYIGYHATWELEDGYLGSGLYLWNSIRKYGIANFKREVLFIFSNSEEAYSKEKELIELYRHKDPLCMNLMPGGVGGWKENEETRKKLQISGKRVTEAKLKAWEALRGKPRSEETKEKLSLANSGKHLSVETRRKLSLSLKGRKHSERTKAKISKSNLGRIISETAKQKCRDKLLGKPISDQHRANIIASHQHINHSHPHSEETKKRLSELAKGRKMSEETKAKLSKTLSGREGNKDFRHSEETKARMREAQLGKTRSEETKARMREAQQKRRANQS